MYCFAIFVQSYTVPMQSEPVVNYFISCHLLLMKLHKVQPLERSLNLEVIAVISQCHAWMYWPFLNPCLSFFMGISPVVSLA